MGVTASVLPYAACAVACLAWMAVALHSGRAGWAPALACAAAALWALGVALDPDAPLDGIAGTLEVLRSATWIVVLLVLYGHLAGARAAPFIRRFATTGGLLGCVALATALAMPASGVALPLAAFLRLGLVLATLLLVENVWRNADEAGTWHVNLPCIALGGLAAFDLFLYAHAAVSGGFSGALLDARAMLTAVALALLAVAARRDRRWRPRPRVSREVVFHGATFIAVGAFLLGVGLFGQVLRHVGFAWGDAAQASLVATGLLGGAAALSARSVRSRLRRVVVDHFFAARYDYRSEWLRCVAALSSPEGEAPVRAIRAIADAVDSPAGVLLLKRDDAAAAEGRCPIGRLDWAGSWNRPALPFTIGSGALLAAFGETGRVVPLDALAPGDLPRDHAPLWLAVPLLHHEEGVFGAVLLAPPRAPFPLDEEVFALLRTLGREVALVLAERRAAERLAEGQGLAEHARRFAFVAHDLKTVASQLGLLLANADEHMGDPEFQRDMVLTARASATRMNALIARLRTAEAGGTAEEPTPSRPPPLIEPAPRLRSLAASRTRPVDVVEEVAVGRIAMAPEAFDSAVTHLLDNALEASPVHAPVRLRLWRRDGAPMLDIVDRGAGMSERFVREELFRPLATTKPGGSGIGAWQARELLRAVGGDLTAISTPGAGTIMRLALPGQPDPVADDVSRLEAIPA